MDAPHMHFGPRVKGVCTQCGTEIIGSYKDYQYETGTEKCPTPGCDTMVTCLPYTPPPADNDLDLDSQW